MNLSGDLSDADGGSGPLADEEWHNFLTVGGGLVYRGTTADKFLDWASKYGHHLLPGMTAAVANTADVPRVLRSLAVQM